MDSAAKSSKHFQKVFSRTFKSVHRTAQTQFLENNVEQATETEYIVFSTKEKMNCGLELGANSDLLC